MITFGSGQTNGLPLAVTATPTTVHTAPAGSATPHRVSFRVSNLDNSAHQLTLTVLKSDTTVESTLVVTVPARALNLDALAPAPGGVPVPSSQPSELVLNGSSYIQASDDGSGKLQINVRVDDQASVAGVVSQTLASGLIAAAQNASRFGVGVQGGTGATTAANGEIKVARAGTIRNLRASASAAVGGGATVTVSVFVNGVVSAALLTLANADGTGDKTATTAISVAAGDRVTFSVATDNAGAPAANIHAAAEFV